MHKTQKEVAKWGKKNFPDATPWMCLLGVMEEVGELSHAHLKAHQNIRSDIDSLIEKEKDAIGDILVFLMHFCALSGYDMAGILQDTWSVVRERDWRKASP